MFITVSIIQELTIFGQKTFHCLLPQTALNKNVPKYDTPSTDGEVMKICNTVSESKFKVPANDDFILELSVILSFDIKTTTLWQKGLLTFSGRQAM